LLSVVILSNVILSIVYSLFAYAASQNAEPRYLFVYIMSVAIVCLARLSAVTLFVVARVSAVTLFVVTLNVAAPLEKFLAISTSKFYSNF